MLVATLAVVVPWALHEVLGETPFTREIYVAAVAQPVQAGHALMLLERVFAAKPAVTAVAVCHSFQAS